MKQLEQVHEKRPYPFAPTPRELNWVRGRFAGYGLQSIGCEDGGWALAEGYGVGRWPDAGGESWENILQFIRVRDRGDRE